MSKSRWWALAGFLLAAFVVAGLGGAATSSSVRTWYPELAKPDWTPPSWVFGPAWTALYIMMSVAGWRIWLRRDEPGARLTLKLYAGQLAANALWSVLFFGLRRPDLALIDIAVLWTLLVVLQVRLCRQDRLAGALWLPYLAWVSFASALNASVWWLNR